jgi:hypothetical protein
MPLAPPNVTFDVYRQYAPATPYTPPGVAAICAGQGHLRQHVRNGRFGYAPAWVGGGAQKVYWTTILDVAAGTDIESAWNSQQNAFNEANGDTIFVHDYPIAGTCTAFVAVMVQLRGAGGPNPYLRVYMDRAQPNCGTACPTCVVGQGKKPRVPPGTFGPPFCCPAGQLAPLTMTARITGGTSCLVGAVFTMTFNPSVLLIGPGYDGLVPDSFIPICGSNAGAGFFLICTVPNGWGLLQSCGVNLNSIGGFQFGACDPFFMTFATTNNDCYGGSFTITFSEP